jgi:predicted metal-dependent peptidase
LPGAFVEIISAVDEPEKVAWQDQLANVTRHAIGQARVGGLDYSLARPSRRSYLRGWPIPGLVKRDLTVAVALDSSGSMGTDTLKTAVAETASVLRQCGLDRLWLVIVDAALQAEPRLVDVHDLVELAVPGRGGTSFKPGVEAVGKLEPRPDVTIYFTDGAGDNPDEPEDIRFIWGVIGPHKLSVAWGEEVRIE